MNINENNMNRHATFFGSNESRSDARSVLLPSGTNIYFESSKETKFSLFYPTESP